VIRASKNFKSSHSNCQAHQRKREVARHPHYAEKSNGGVIGNSSNAQPHTEKRRENECLETNAKVIVEDQECIVETWNEGIMLYPEK